ncbi:unnamed protein product [Caenorhabditis bovis]|uniref:tRNA (uracil-O(2)-)-methyltransferase n=1 Tax=Caenorhabditis bovis TaxID=2654633 RepID=A0A8S1EP51_9PELO|nr:unnamed protein product [Caenorhabditis bovis]
MHLNLIREELIEFESEVDVKAYFDRAIELYNDSPRAYVKRIYTTVRLETNSEEANLVLAIAKQQKDVQLNNDCEIRKILCHQASISKTCYEIFYYEESFLAKFIPVNMEPEKPHAKFDDIYSIGCTVSSENCVKLQLFSEKTVDDPKIEFLKNPTFSHLIMWMRTVDPSRQLRKTHALIDKESYATNYKQIKLEFGKHLVEAWDENTNAEKFVYEDCGIATYIQEIFNANILKRPKKFVDIGCGNGLLVNLLNKIGIPGYGVDVRSRRIWSTLCGGSDLREFAVNPQMVLSNVPHFDADTDLLIGNHSDELTPWIALMAAKMNCEFFIIPCCPFEFFGKFNRPNYLIVDKKVSKSQFETFFDWVVHISEMLGFEVDTDRLMIPSTRRLCIVGRIPKTGLVANLDQVIHDLTDGKEFVPRPAEIKNRNCTDIPVEVRIPIVEKLFKYLLESSDEVKDGWHIGGEISIESLARILTDEEKKLMKDQCGGLQTFMKNHHQVFNVHGGVATLRDFRSPHRTRKRNAKKALAKKLLREKQGIKPAPKYPCFMAANHPDGCQLSEEDCKYAH